MQVCKYLVTVQHRTGAKPWEGQHEFTIHRDLAGGLYCAAPHFGCSKNHETALAAMTGILRDHACVALALKELD